MDPEDVSTFVQGDEIRYLGGRQSFVRSYAQRLVEEAFPGQAGQNPFPECGRAEDSDSQRRE